MHLLQLMFLTNVLCIFTKHDGSTGNVYELYMSGTPFKSRSGHRLFSFLWFLTVSRGKWRNGI